MQGLFSHLAELTARVQQAAVSPALICLNETFLDGEVIELPGYVQVARKDRARNCRRGGVLIFAAAGISSRVTCVHESTNSERIWVVIHSDKGEILVGSWYRTPGAMDHDKSIATLKEEQENLSKNVTGCLLVGDLNVHHKHWLQHSSGISQAGELLRQTAAEIGLKQAVKHPTRGKYLLDLALTDIPEVDIVVLPAVADHKLIQVTLSLPIVEEICFPRKIWLYQEADWDRMRDNISQSDWASMQDLHPDTAVMQFNATLQSAMEKSVPQKIIKQRQSTHPWLNNRVKEAVRKKNQASSTQHAATAARNCTRVISEERYKWEQHVRQDMLALPRGSRAWWNSGR